MARSSPLELFHPVVREWFAGSFDAPTRPQQLGWPVIARGESCLILAPTGSGKTLAAFLWCLNRLLFSATPDDDRRCRIVYVSPLKALAVDVERNLRAPLAGIANLAQRRSLPVSVPRVAIRTGDTPPEERARFLRHPADILITTPESLFLLLTSRARDRLRGVETVIIDEIHALVPNKRGAHLALSLERLAARTTIPPQRIGLSATQRPLDEVARYLGGAGPRHGDRASARASRAALPREGLEAALLEDVALPAAPPLWRPVAIVDASERKRIRVRVEVPVEDMARPDDVPFQSGPVTRDPAPGSIWASIHPRLLDLIRAHRSTLIFVNSRRLAERLAAALNDLAEEPLVRAHHGSLARATRNEVEDLLKAGRIRGLVATSSLELGIDMGAIDLVVQIEAPPSVASGLQRVGRAGHQAGAVSEGLVFPKFRGDLVACAAVVRRMRDGEVEPSRYPRSPLDVLAQHLVAMVGMDDWNVDALFEQVRCAAPYAELGRATFEGVLDMLSGRYPSDEFAELRPRITWDRVEGRLTARQGAVQLAIANAGTIPDRGLYGVFLAGADRPVRVGELDEEMVHECQPGETFTLGASTWRIEDITHDRVLVTPAPGESGRMPFWHGDQAGRPVELGMAIGRLVRQLRAAPREQAEAQLVEAHGLDPHAAASLLQYLQDQAAAGVVPDDRTLVIERGRDELGDWRLCLLSPLGGRIHAPWAMAVTAHVRQQTGLDVEVMWGDEGFVVRFPELEQPPDPLLLVPDPDDVEALVTRQLGATALFAARFRETAARALLLPRRRAGQRTPLWKQRKRAAGLLTVASRYGSFPALLETYRELLRDQFDMPALVDTLRRAQTRRMRVAIVEAEAPSPFAASLLFNYVANFIYDGDAPLAERRAQALSVDQAQLRELLGDDELRDLLDADALVTLEREIQHLVPERHARSLDAMHDLLLRLGDLTATDLQARCDRPDVTADIAALTAARRAVPLMLMGELRYVAVEDVARYRDAVGTPLPPGLPDALLEPVLDPAGDLALRYARTHGPFTPADLTTRLGWPHAHALALLQRLTTEGRLVEGQFRPGGQGTEWIDGGVLRALRRRSLARLRREIEPVDAEAFGRFAMGWHGVAAPRSGMDALLDVVEQLQGAALPASVLEREILPARIAGYEPVMLDTLMAAGEVVWAGVEPLGSHDGRVALYLTDHVALLHHRSSAPPQPEGRAAAVREHLATRGASFFAAVHEGTGGGFAGETVDAIWELVWAGLVTNDSMLALRALTRTRGPGARPSRRAAFRSRRVVPSTAEGRWTLLPATSPTATAHATALAQQLLVRHGVVTRETAQGEGVPGGFSAVYQVLKAMEESGRVRRGYFVAGLGGAQFAMPAAVDALRAEREAAQEPGAIVLSATDPANPYGTVLPWPAGTTGRADPPGAGAPRGRGPTRTAGARVVIVNGAVAAYLRRGARELLLSPPPDEPSRTAAIRAVARALVREASRAEPAGMLITDVDAVPPRTHPAARLFLEAGFADTALGLQLRTSHERPRGYEAPLAPASR